MKKKLIGLLASLACLACFAGCNNPLYSGDSGISGSNAGNSSNIETSSGNLENSSSTNEEKSYDPQGAASYIESMYKNNNKTGRVDYEVVKKVLYDGDIYTIAWSVNVDCVTVVEEDDKFIIDVDEATTVDTPFILTATLTAPDGSTAKVELNRILTAAPSKVPAQITGDPVEGTEYKLYVYQAANKKDLYINGKMKNTYYFDTTDSFEEGISIYVEKTQGGFYLYHNVVEAEGEEPVKTYINIVKSGTHTNAKYETTASSVFVYDETLGTMVVNLDGTKYYLGADGTFNTVEPQSKLEDGYYMGYLVSLVDASSVTAEDKVEQTLKELSIAPVYVGNNEIELAKQGIRFADTKISWTVEGAGAVLDGNKLSLTAQSAASEITLKATAKNGEVSDEAELKFKLVPNTAAEIVKAATSLKAGESFGNSVELTGIVTAIPSPYAEQYANVTVSMLVEGKTIDAYRLVGVGADVLAKGYTVTVKGVITNYNGTVQFGQGCEIVSFVEGDESDIPSAPTYTMAQIVDMAYELAPGAKLDGTQTLKGVITKINTPYDAGYGNITVTIVVEGKDDKPIECYRLKGDEAASLKVGDTITVSGTIKHYSYDGTSVGKIEFDAGCTIDAYEAGEGGVVTPPDDGGNEGEKPNSDVVTAPVADTAYLMFLEQKSLNSTLYLTGKPDTTNSKFLGMTVNAAEAAYVYAEVVDGGYMFYVLDDNNAKSYIELTEYQKEGESYYRASIAWSATGSVFHYEDIGCWAATLANDTFFIGTYQSFNTASASSSFYMTADKFASQYPLQLVLAENVDVTPPDDGGEVTPPETPETPDDGGDVVEGEALTLDFGDVANRVSQDTASQIWAQNGVTVTNNKAKSTSNVADYSAPARFYKSSELIVECDNMVKIVFECATYQSKDYASDLVNSIADDANISVTKDGTTVTVVFASAVDSLTISSLAAQVRVNSISVYTA